MINTRNLLYFFVIGLGAAVSACRGGQSYEAFGMAGHTRMIAILDSIAEHASPDDCYNLNPKKAEWIEQQMPTLPPQQQVFALFKHAEQLLYAGKTENATTELSEVIQRIHDKMTPDTKVVYEFLALSYLRLGEVQNCVENNTSESCIVPIQPGGYYTLKSGPEQAIKIYQRILKEFPNDMQSRWLLNIAYMNLGKWPAEVPKEWLIPTTLFQERGNLHFRNIAPQLGLGVRGISGGVCIDDFDNDGDLDLFMTSYGMRDQCQYFRNNGDGTFSERTHEANLTGIVSGLNTIQADYDNDGDRDILILRGGWLEGGTHPNSLLRNNGDGTFTDVTIDAGLLSFHPTQAADWADFDGDGWLDLYIANETRLGNASTKHPNELYHNNKNGTFTNVAPQTGLNLIGFFKAAVWGDINNDQRPDLYLSDIAGLNRLLVNRGGPSAENWIFQDIAAKAGVQYPLLSFPTMIFDYDNDGWDDILVTGYNFDANQQAAGDMLLEMMGKPPEGDWLRLYHNNRNETFTDVSREAGLHKLTYAMGCNFGDLDNDGWLDFYLGTGKPDLRALVPNRMFRNVEGTRFEEITMNGFAHIQKGHGVAFGDLDNDGDEDIYEVMGGAYEGDFASNVLFENSGTDNHWVQFFLVGKTCNRDARGARVVVHVRQKNGQPRSIYATCGTGGSFGASSMRVEMGLGQAAAIDSVEVRWPKAGLPTAVFTNVPMDQFVQLEEGNPSPKVLALKPIRFSTEKKQTQ